MTAQTVADRRPAHLCDAGASSPTGDSEAIHQAGAAWEDMPDEARAADAERMEASVLNRDWLRWQWVDSAFPTGGFAHSVGLEAAWQHGEVRNRDQFREWLRCSLHQVARGSLPWVTTAHDEPARLEELDRHCDIFTSNHVSNRASRLQGRALLAAANRVFKTGISPPTLGHYGPVFGRVTGALQFSRLESARLFVFIHLRGAMAAAVRLNIVGSMDAQSLQFQMADQAEVMVQCGAEWTLHDLAQTAPLLDLWQGAQDRLYSRLFQS